MRFTCLGAHARWRLEQVRELLTVHEDVPGHSEHHERQARHQRDPQMDLAQGAARAPVQIDTPLG
jgi:hypothetical protein